MSPGMQLSAFNLYVEDFPHPGETLVHNTFSGAYVVLDRQEMAWLHAATGSREMSAASRPRVSANDSLTARATEWSHPDVGIVVESLDAEREAYQTWFARERARPTMHVIISLNLACNFDCPYCCQADVMDGSVMSPEIIEESAVWLASRASTIGAESLRLTLMGGEPLLHPERIKQLTARVRELLEKPIDVKLSLITNGYFLTEEMVRDLLPYGLDAAQVTLDGDASTHHLSRVSKRGENTFQRIFDNTISASRIIRIVLNGNYQEHTISGFGPLVDQLADAGLPAETPFHFSPALESLSAPAGSVESACNWSHSPFEYRVALHDRILERGFQIGSLNFVGPCGFHSHHVYALDPQGNIFKCPGFLGHPAWRVGHVGSGLTERYAEMLAWDATSGCGRCAHRPNCGGGCVADVMLRTGVMDVNCEATYLHAMEQHALPRNYLLAVEDDRERALSRFPTPPRALPAPAGAQPPASGVRVDALRVL